MSLCITEFTKSNTENWADTADSGAENLGGSEKCYGDGEQNFLKIKTCKRQLSVLEVSSHTNSRRYLKLLKIFAWLCCTPPILSTSPKRVDSLLVAVSVYICFNLMLLTNRSIIIFTLWSLRPGRLQSSLFVRNHIDNSILPL